MARRASSWDAEGVAAAWALTLRDSMKADANARDTNFFSILFAPFINAKFCVNQPIILYRTTRKISRPKTKNFSAPKAVSHFVGSTPKIVDKVVL